MYRSHVNPPFKLKNEATNSPIVGLLIKFATVIPGIKSEGPARPCTMGHAWQEKSLLSFNYQWLIDELLAEVKFEPNLHGMIFRDATG